MIDKKNKIKKVFDRDLAETIFNMLTPISQIDKTSKSSLKPLIKRDSLESLVAKGIDAYESYHVSSYNRIPTDRARDVIVYFIEEVFGTLDELYESTSDDLERCYLIASDLDGALCRLVVSHSFLRIEIRTKRPNQSKSTLKKKPMYQRYWQPIRAIQDNGFWQILDFPNKEIVIQKSGNVSIVDPNSTKKEIWDNGIQIGKVNLVALVSVLRWVCYEILFESKNAYQTLMDSSFMRYFKIVNDLLYDKLERDVFGLSNENIVVATSKRDKEIDSLFESSPMASKYVLLSGDFYNGDYKEVPVYQTSAFNPTMIDRALRVDRDLTKQEQEEWILGLKNCNQKYAFDVNSLFNIPYFSLFLFPTSYIKMDVQEIDFYKKEKQILTTTYEKKIKDISSIKTQVKNEFFVFLKHKNKREIIFYFGSNDISVDSYLVNNYHKSNIDQSIESQLPNDGFCFQGIVRLKYDSFSNGVQMGNSHLEIEIKSMIKNQAGSKHTTIEKISKNFLDFMCMFWTIYHIGQDGVDNCLILDTKQMKKNALTNLTQIEIDDVVNSLGLVAMVDGTYRSALVCDDYILNRDTTSKGLGKKIEASELDVENLAIVEDEIETNEKIYLEIRFDSITNSFESLLVLNVFDNENDHPLLIWTYKKQIKNEFREDVKKELKSRISFNSKQQFLTRILNDLFNQLDVDFYNILSFNLLKKYHEHLSYFDLGVSAIKDEITNTFENDFDMENMVDSIRSEHRLKNKKLIKFIDDKINYVVNMGDIRLTHIEKTFLGTKSIEKVKTIKKTNDTMFTSERIEGLEGLYWVGQYAFLELIIQSL